MQASLVERVREIEELNGLVAAAKRGAGCVALIEGVPGVGKTRLLGEARRRAETQGMRVLSARGSGFERLFSFGVVRQLLEATLADPALREAALAGPAGPAKPILLAGASASGETGADVSFTTLHALYWLVLNLAEQRPLMLVIDDLQWCDSDSLRFLAYLAGRIEGQPVLLGATLRSSSPDADEALIGEIMHAPGVIGVRPGPFSEEAVSELVRERLGPNADPAFCRACHAATSGNPLLLHQLLAALKADGVRPVEASIDVVRDIGPQAVARTVTLHLARLPEAASTVARAVAVLGQAADLATLAAFTRLDESAIAQASGALVRADILTAGSPPQFVHPLVRDAVYDRLSAPERALEHERAASVVAEMGGSDEQVAGHVVQMARRSQAWVVDRLATSAREALARGSADAAVGYLRRALEEPPAPDQRSGLLLELGMAEALTSGPEAVEHLRDALAESDDAQEIATAAPLLAQSMIFTGSAQDAAALARETRAKLPEHLTDAREVLEAIELGTTMFGVSEPAMLKRLAGLGSEPVGPGPGAKMLGALAAWESMLTGGAADACAALALDALADDTMVAADNGFLTVPAIGVLFLADRDEAIGQWARLLGESHRSGSLFAVSCVHLWSGMTLLRRGDLVEAEGLFREGRNELQLWGSLLVDGAYFTSALALVRLEQGDVEGARKELGAQPHPSFDAYDAAHLWRRSEVEVLLAEGQNAQAAERAEEYGRIVGRLVNPAWVPWRSLLAIALDRLGRGTEALALVEEELVHARAWGAPGTVGRTLRIRGILRRDEGMADLEESVRVLSGSPATLELAKSLAALGSAIRRSGRPSDARDPLRRGLELAERCGARALEADTRTELYASGSRPRSAELTGAGSLTASEKRVAELAAEGLTNRDIAQRLFVTPKTVEVHLSATYRKLGIASRRDLSRGLAPA